MKIKTTIEKNILKNIFLCSNNENDSSKNSPNLNQILLKLGHNIRL